MTRFFALFYFGRETDTRHCANYFPIYLIALYCKHCLYHVVPIDIDILGSTMRKPLWKPLDRCGLFLVF